MGADDDLRASVLQAPLAASPRPCRRGATAGRSRCPARAKRAEELAKMLLGEHGRRRDHRDLLAGEHRGGGGAKRHLGLAIADIAADQPLHRMAGRQIVEHVQAESGPPSARRQSAHKTARRRPGPALSSAPWPRPFPSAASPSARRSPRSPRRSRRGALPVRPLRCRASPRSKARHSARPRRCRHRHQQRLVIPIAQAQGLAFGSPTLPSVRWERARRGPRHRIRYGRPCRRSGRYRPARRTRPTGHRPGGGLLAFEVAQADDGDAAFGATKPSVIGALKAVSTPAWLSIASSSPGPAERTVERRASLAGCRSQNAAARPARTMR